MNRDKKEAKLLLKEVELELKKVSITQEHMLYVTLYHTACALQLNKKYHLSKTICKALLREIKKDMN